MAGKLFEEVMKFNPYHDARGRFASSGNYTSFTYAPGKSRAHDLAIERQKERLASQMPSEAQAKTLKGIESRTRNLKKEQYRVVDREGNVVLQKQGDQHSVSYTIGEAREHIPGNITIHNHPDGGTFSSADLSDIGHGATEIRAAAPEGTYILRNMRHGAKYDLAKEKTWYEMRDDIDAASEGFKTHRQLKSEIRKPFDEQLGGYAKDWVKRKEAGASQEELTRISNEYNAKAESLRPQIEAAARKAYVDQYHHWYQANAGSYGLEYEFVPVKTRTRKSYMMDDFIETIGKSEGDIVLDRQMNQDVAEIADAILNEMKAAFPTVRKSEDNDVSIIKTDDDKRLVFGWASISMTVDGEQLEDRQNDMIDPEDLEEAVYEYVLHFRDTGEEHIPSMRKKGKLVESCVFTEEKQRAMGIQPGVVPVGWWIGFKIEDDDAWQRVKNGTYRMFSIEGKANREPVEKRDTKRDYDAYPEYGMWLEENLDATVEEQKAAEKHYSSRSREENREANKRYWSVGKADRGEQGALFIGLNVTGVDDLAMDGGESKDDFHVTLLYGYFNPKGHDSSSVDSIVNSAVQAVKAEIPEMIEFDRISTFDPSESSDGKRVIYARVKSGQLEDVHDKILAELKKNGLPVEKTFPKYQPHMTLAYVDPDEEAEDVDIEATGKIKNITIGLKGPDKEMNNNRTVAKTFHEILGHVPAGLSEDQRFDHIEEVVGKSDRFDHIEEVQKFNPYHDSRGRFASANGATSFTYSPGKSNAHDLAIARAAAKDKVAKAKEAEPKLTSMMEGCAEAAGGEMVGLKYAVKGEGSLTRKIKTEMGKNGSDAKAAVAEMRDVNRYTMKLTEDNFLSGYESTMNTLKDQGHEVVRVKNSLGDTTASYRGVNTSIKGPDGSIWELQFHTAKSLEVKEVNHKLYETQRLDKTPAAKRAELGRQMAENAASIPSPKGIEKIVPFSNI